MSAPAGRPERDDWATLAEGAIGLGCVLVFISLFLTWKTLTISDKQEYHSSVTLGSASGLNSWGILTLVFLLVTAAVFLSGFVSLGRFLERLPVPHALVFTLGGAGELVTILLFSHHYQGSLKFGFGMALVGAAITFLAGVVALLRPQAASAPRRPYDHSAQGPSSAG
ncbi:MAG TPA: hypothetical protein VHX88_10590 [Solirubrobacteraceae bacterium]|jgi:hypothetical protein|nr:hypothetical protein [Solirubrobacteraceae bacterium]